MNGTQLISDSLTAIEVAAGIAILAAIWVIAVTAAAAMYRRQEIRHVQQAATAITAAAAYQRIQADADTRRR